MILPFPSLTATQVEELCEKFNLELRFGVLPQAANLHLRRQSAILYLRKRGLYILDKGAKKPGWGNGEVGK